MGSVVRTNPFVEVRPAFDDGAEFALWDYDRNRRVDLPNVAVVEMLGWAADGTERDELVERAAGAFDRSRSHFEAVVDEMLTRELLLPRAEYPDDLLDRKAEWAASNWGPAFEYYLGIRDFPFYEEQGREQPLERARKRYEEFGEPPDVYKTYDDAETVPLPAVDESASVGSVRVVADGSPDGPGRELGVQELSRLLYYTFGETGRQSLPGVGDFLLKTSPSGGSRHPTEAYVLARSVDGLEAGAYHYSVKEHGLERLGDADDVSFDGDASAAARLVLTARVERNMWKYRDPRAFRIPHHDAGHLLETLRLVCTAMGLAVRFTPRYGDPALGEVLDVRPLREPLLGYATVG